MNDYQNIADYYDYLYKINTTEIKFYKKYINPFKKILEVGCGTGRLTVELAKKSFWKSYNCIDISEPMLKILREKIKTQSLLYPCLNKINIKREDMQKLNDESIYDIIIYSFQSIQCMPKNDIIKQIILSEKILSKNGLLIISTFDPTIGFIQNSEHLNSLGLNENKEVLMLVDNDIEYNEEIYKYKQNLRFYNKNYFHIRTLSDDFSIANVNYEFIKNIHKDTNLELIGFFSDYSKKAAQKDDKYYINVYKKNV